MEQGTAVMESKTEKPAGVASPDNNDKRPDPELLEAVRRLDMQTDLPTEQLLDCTRGRA